MSENVTKTKEQDGQKPGEDYRDADGILVCGKCGEPRERMFPAGGIFKEPHLVPTMCRCQREEADRQREETERAEKRRRTERLRKQCFPSSGRYAFCTFDADDGRNAAQSTVCKAFAATSGDALAAGAVLDYFNDFMDGLCTGFYTDADGFWDYGIDLSMKSFMQAKLLRAMLRFKP